MKKSILWNVLLILVTMMILGGCSREKEDPGDGEVRFTFNNVGNTSTGRTTSENTPAYVQYLIETPDGETISDVLQVYPFGEGYVSQQQQLPEGKYILEEYFILNSDNKVLYAAVLKGAPLESMVNQTLPIEFVVAVNETTSVAPDVIQVEDQSPEEFGYVKWAYNVSASMVHIVLPVHESVIAYFNAATLTVTQGGYTKTVPMKSNVYVGYVGKVLLRPDMPVDISVSVDVRDIHTTLYGHEMNDIEKNTSVSRFDYTTTVSSIACDIYALNEFKYKIGNGWDFKFAEITSHGPDGSYFKIRYDEKFYCDSKLNITTNGTLDLTRSTGDKIVWEQTDVYSSGDGVIDSFDSPVCTDICKATVDFTAPSTTAEAYNMYSQACSLDEWEMIDSELKVFIEYKGRKIKLSSYLKLLKDVDDELPTLMESSSGKVMERDAFIMPK